jgi:hypothetical protein
LQVFPADAGDFHQEYDFTDSFIHVHVGLPDAEPLFPLGLKKMQGIFRDVGRHDLARLFSEADSDVGHAASSRWQA